jgi:U32 family peptidase
MPSPSPMPCQLIAPAGSWESARAAVENRADAIYFGLQKGINARTRAVNFLMEDLPKLMFYLHQRGVKGFLTLNTLVFAEELAAVEQIAREAIRSGVDAFIVQDIGLLRLLHELCPEFPLHASTQMTLSSADCIRAVESYGVKRVVLPRELSLAEIAAVHRLTSTELEVFVHGALCISYSGQCTASLALGGRSGNRGQCAQACRMSYEWLENNTSNSPDTPAKRYWLSPLDLALWDWLPELLAAGVSAIKIEGRMKEPEYVALVTRCYRQALDAALQHEPFVLEPERIEEMEVAFSRGFSAGWLEGPQPQVLVPGKYTAKRGIPIGSVSAIHGDRVLVRLTRTVRRGQGVVFEEKHDQDSEQGGRIYEIFVDRRSVEEVDGESEVELAFGRNDLDLMRIQSGQQIYRTDDPQLMKELRKTFDVAVPQRRVFLDLVIRAAVGEKLHLEALSGSGANCVLESDEPLVEAIKHPLTVELLREQFGRLGETPYQLRYLNARIEGQPMIPLSVLGQIRRSMVAALDESIRKPSDYSLPEEPILPDMRKQARQRRGEAIATALQKQGSLESSKKPRLHVLCRSVQQVEAVAALDVDTIYADFLAIEDYAGMVSLTRFAGKKIVLATTRIHRPDSAISLEYLAKQKPDGILARNLAAIDYFQLAGLATIADYSLNATNDLATNTLLERGASRVTAAFDLNQSTFTDMVRQADPRSLELILHGHIPMFHTAHCLYCAAYSNLNAKPDCGRPCLKRKSRLRDRRGYDHPVLFDADCRNIVFHSQPQSLAEYYTWLLSLGLQHFRIELLDHTEKETTELIGLYRDLMDRRRKDKDVLQRLSAARSSEVNRGTWRFEAE